MIKIRLLLVDDHGVVRSGLRMLLESEQDMEIVGEATGGLEAIKLVQQYRPHVALMDVQMGDMSGIEATREIKRLCPDTRILALTMYENEHYLLEMLKAGASGYVPKRAAPDELVDAIRTVHQGNVFLYPTVANLLVQNYLGTQDVAEEEDLALDLLTPREQEVLVHIAEGLTNPEIGQKLDISVKTVDRHRENIMQKLNMRSRVDLAKFAIKHGLISLDD
ncbi:MAG: response regulator transcription factor [Ardenticatenaceae bacterium]|nr:response regulator transcription factor [Ardenticatenaceae bacterium]